MCLLYTAAGGEENLYLLDDLSILSFSIPTFKNHFFLIYRYIKRQDSVNHFMHKSCNEHLPLIQ